MTYQYFDQYFEILMPERVRERRADGRGRADGSGRDGGSWRVMEGGKPWEVVTGPGGRLVVGRREWDAENAWSF